jgi:hypothetical protein
MLKLGLCLVVAIPALLVLGGCGSSTAPHTITAAQLAEHIDSLSLQAYALGDSAGVYRYLYLSGVEEAPAYGATPVTVDVSINGAGQIWQGFMWRTGAASIYGPDSTFWIAAYSDYSFKNVLLAEAYYTAGQSSADASMLTDDTLLLSGGAGTTTGATRSLGATCAFTQGLHNYPIEQQGCVLGAFEGSVNWTFPSGVAGQTGTTVLLRAHGFNGVALH